MNQTKIFYYCNLHNTDTDIPKCAKCNIITGKCACPFNRSYKLSCGCHIWALYDGRIVNKIIFTYEKYIEELETKNKELESNLLEKCNDYYELSNKLGE